MAKYKVYKALELFAGVPDTFRWGCIEAEPLRCARPMNSNSDPVGRAKTNTKRRQNTAGTAILGSFQKSGAPSWTPIGRALLLRTTAKRTRRSQTAACLAQSWQPHEPSWATRELLLALGEGLPT